MRLSKFTNIVPLSDTATIIYNSLSDKFLILKESVDSIGNLVDWAQPHVIEKLRAIKAVVDDNADEAAELQEIIDATDNNNSEYHLHINPTLNCNFKCWYCYENHIVGSKMEAETVRRTILHARKKIESLKPEVFTLGFFGGEPLMYFDSVAKVLINKIGDICEANRCHLLCQFTTNGALISDEIREFLKPYQVSFQITLDGHRDYHNKVRFNAAGGSYDTIIDNILKLTLDGHYVILRVNYTSENIVSVPNILQDIKDFPKSAKENIKIDFQQVWQDTKGNRETEHYEDVRQIMLDANEMKFQTTRPLRGLPMQNSCYGDKRNHVLINYNGDAFFCTARDFTPQNRAGFLNKDGEIEWIDNALEKWMKAKFTRPVCRNCRIAGICAGGCRQKCTELAHITSCPHGYTDEDKDDIVLSRMEKFLSTTHYLS